MATSRGAPTHFCVAITGRCVDKADIAAQKPGWIVGRLHTIHLGFVDHRAVTTEGAFAPVGATALTLQNIPVEAQKLLRTVRPGKPASDSWSLKLRRTLVTFRFEATRRQISLSPRRRVLAPS